MTTPPPPSRPSIKISYVVPRRGGTVETSNRYFFEGDNFTLAQFNAVRDLLLAEYALILPTDCSYNEQTQYDIGSDVPVRTTSVTAAGTMSLSGRTRMSSDSCAMARFSTTQRTSKNHPIYLFKYWHGTVVANGAAVDEIDPTQLTRYRNMASDLVAGLNDGATVRHITGPYGAVAQGSLVTEFVHHRDFRT